MNTNKHELFTELNGLYNLLTGRRSRQQFKPNNREELQTCIQHASKESSCTGDEPLPQFSLNSIRWDKKKRASALLDGTQEDNQYHFLVSYYSSKYGHDYNFVDEDVMEVDDRELVIVKNEIKKFLEIQILGNVYKSKESGRRNGYVCAYKSLDNEMILWPCQIQFFFRHVISCKDAEDKMSEAPHYFAFVRWFRRVDPSTQGITSFNSGTTTGVWQNTFEDLSVDCFLPVQRIHAKTNIYLEYLKNINVVTFLQQEIY